VLLLRRETTAAQRWDIVDHFVLERPGRWGFATLPGRYAVTAFEDRSRDLIYQPGETYGALGLDKPIVCARGVRVPELAVEIPPSVTTPFPQEVDVARVQARSMSSQMHASLGQLTVLGEIVTLADPRFRRAHADAGVWRPYDFVVHPRAGIYFLAPYEEHKVPVLFVHGINGSPTDFGALISRLDRGRFQPWLYYYPSGIELSTTADHLDQTMAKLRLRFGFERFAVVGHSMGGLVARGFLQRHAHSGRPAAVPLFVTISAPWGGHEAARGVRGTPLVASWRDMAPGSAYQNSLYAAPLPKETQHHLLFTFNREEVSQGESDDGAVTVASQLAAPAQRDASFIYGFDETHRSVLRSAEVAALVNRLLQQRY
jgi:pimeloyl-ACP methyl ester carboxylesterase